MKDDFTKLTENINKARVEVTSPRTPKEMEEILKSCKIPRGVYRFFRKKGVIISVKPGYVTFQKDPIFIDIVENSIKEYRKDVSRYMKTSKEKTKKSQALLETVSTEEQSKFKEQVAYACDYFGINNVHWESIYSQYSSGLFFNNTKSIIAMYLELELLSEKAKELSVKMPYKISMFLSAYHDAVYKKLNLE